MSTVSLLLRLVFAMAAVVAVMWVAARLLARRTGGVRPRGNGPQVEVVARRGLSRSSSVAVVRAGGRTLVLGVTDTNITLLAEADPSALESEDGDSGMLSPGGNPSPARMQILESIRERTVRR